MLAENEWRWRLWGNRWSQTRPQAPSSSPQSLLLAHSCCLACWWNEVKLFKLNGVCVQFLLMYILNLDPSFDLLAKFLKIKHWSSKYRWRVCVWWACFLTPSCSSMEQFDSIFECKNPDSNPTSSLMSSVTLGKLLDLSVPWFLRLQNGDNDIWGYFEDPIKCLRPST